MFEEGLKNKVCALFLGSLELFGGALERCTRESQKARLVLSLNVKAVFPVLHRRCGTMHIYRASKFKKVHRNSPAEQQRDAPKSESKEGVLVHV